MLRFGALTALLVVGVVAIALATRDRPAARVLFRDDFNGSRLDTRHWRTCHWWANGGCTIGTNNESEWYLPSQVRVAGGRVHLVAERRDVRGSDGRTYPYASGMISSGPGPHGRPGFAFRYGRAEIRAHIKHGAGLWPAFWLLPADRRSEPEIDVMEIYGEDWRTVVMHLHYRRGGREHQRGHHWTGLDGGWHRFAIDWRPGRLTWLVDGVPRWRLRGRAVPHERMYLVANLAVGARAGSVDSRTPMPASYDIDWIRVVR